MIAQAVMIARPCSTTSGLSPAIGCLIAGLAAAGCGDNHVPPVGPPLTPADTLNIIAHLDDDMIFMQPELHAAVASGSVTTVYVSSGDPVYGNDRADLTFEAAMRAYASVARSSDWDCGYLSVAGSPVHHCRLRDRPVSMIGLDTADGALDGHFAESPLHLVEGGVPAIPILGPIGGRATVDSIVASLSEIIAATQPSQLHALDLASTHGHDHSGHMFSSAFALWAAARARYAGPTQWHRGYNVKAEPITLGEPDYQLAKRMLGYFEACAFGCGPCDTSCQTIDVDHDAWLRRQYRSTRSSVEATGTLALDGSSGCLSVNASGAIVLGDCQTAAPVHLDPGGHLAVGDACLATQPGNGDPLALEVCQDAPSQYWVVDSDGMVWNGRPPVGVPGMDFDHVRCLAPVAGSGAPIAAPLCGQHLQPHWHITAAR